MTSSVSGYITKSMMPVGVAHNQGDCISVTTGLQRAHAESDALLPQAR